MRRVDLFLSRAFYSVTEREGLRAGAISTLALIVANPGITLSNVSRQTTIDSSGMVKIVDVLEKRKYIRRVKSKSDRRVNELHSTPLGSRKLDEMIEEIKAIELSFIPDISEENRLQMRTMLEAVYYNCLENVPEAGRNRSDGPASGHRT
jgi:DNA-binding MarR family transcriptional regulator